VTRLLFVASEAFPLVKTGGLADIAGALPEVLRREGLDVRLLLPAYGEVLARLDTAPEVIAALDLAGEPARLLQCLLPGTGLVTWLLDHPSFSARPGNPYQDASGADWPDNAQRFLRLCRAAVQLCAGVAGLAWRADILHGNDWHTGPAIALAAQLPRPPRTVFTVHNLAYMGLFDRATFEQLGLPGALWPELEFYGQCSFIKGGLVFADYVTTVSPGYAREICEAPGGMGLEGLLRERGERLVGILNGIDEHTWDPATDPHLARNYDAASLGRKARNRAVLQQQLGLAPADDRPLLGFVGRLVEQKGLELMLPVLESLLESPAQLVVLGTGPARYTEPLARLAAAQPQAMAAVFAYDEPLAHLIEGGADIFLMPSLFEPCGLNQMYSLRYGTLPVVRQVGGLADTVVDASPAHLEAATATGFVFRDPEAAQFLQAVQRAVALWHRRDAWRTLQRTAMVQDFSWRRSAARYLELYRAGAP